MKNLRHRILLECVAYACLWQAANAQLSWDANGSGSGQTNGGGSWLGTNLWRNGTSNQDWVSGSDAIFGGPNTAGGIVTLPSPTSVASITFDTFTYTHPQNATPADGVTATYRWSKDLATFRTGGQTDGDGTTVTFNAVPNTPAVGVTTVIATVTGTATGKLFVDVKVTLN